MLLLLLLLRTTLVERLYSLAAVAALHSLGLEVLALVALRCPARYAPHRHGLISLAIAHLSATIHLLSEPSCTCSCSPNLECGDAVLAAVRIARASLSTSSLIHLPGCALRSRTGRNEHLCPRWWQPHPLAVLDVHWERRFLHRCARRLRGVHTCL